MAVTIKSDRGTLTVSDTLEKMVRMVLDNLAPNVEQILKEDLTTLMQTAKENWLVRSYTNKNGTFQSEFSQNSVDQFEITTQIVAMNGALGIKGTIRNNAPYAYVIRKSANSITQSGPSELPTGSHLWSKTVQEPFVANIEKINAKILVDLKKLQEQ